MGKIIRYDKPAISLFVFLFLLFFAAVYGNASSREYDLLQKGYESYLSYQPEKASEEFRTFLQEFPRSSARDAALFWLGKSLLQSKSTDEAGQVFAELKRQFPDSPFTAFIVTQTEPPESEKLTAIRETEPVPPLMDAVPEPENIKAPDTVAGGKAKEQETVSPQSEVSSEQTSDAMTEVKEPEVKEPEVKEPEVKEPEVKEPEVKEPEVKEPAQLPEDQAIGEETGKLAIEEKKELPLRAEEQVQSDSAGDILPEEETPISGDIIRRDDDQVKTGELSPQSASESDTMAYIQSALHKVGIQGVIWSTGDYNQDFIDEQILYNEAVKLNLSVDEEKLNELRERYTLSMEEADYLKRFLLICTLIDRRVKEIPGEKAVQVLSVQYKDAEQRERPELSAELQALANKGVAFEDISTSYPDVVHFKTVTFQELPEWIQERIQRLQNYEIGVIWSEEGYMILKPNTPVYSYDPFEEMSSEKREILITYIRSWITELKGATPR